MTFSKHLLDAIRLNRARRAHYARSSRGRSLLLSNLLIGLEWLTLPAALHLERRAVTQPRRLELLERAFVPVRGRCSAAPPRRRSGPSRLQRRGVRRVLRTLRRTAARRARLGDLDAVARLGRMALVDLLALEADHDAALAMSVHLVESITRAALEASALELGGDALARDLILLQLAGLPLCVGLDRRAQRLHRSGLNILLDELPAIPLDATTHPLASPRGQGHPGSARPSRLATGPYPRIC